VSFYFFPNIPREKAKDPMESRLRIQEALLLKWKILA
jgi:hypothetical protein